MTTASPALPPELVARFVSHSLAVTWQTMRSSSRFISSGIAASFAAMDPLSRFVGLVSRSCRFAGSWASRSRVIAKTRPSAPLAAAILAAALCLVGSGTAARAGSVNPSFGPIPYNGTEQSRCEGLSVSSHVLFSGDTLIAKASAGICGGPPDNHWSWGAGPVGPGAHGCGENETFCKFKVGSATNAYGLVCINSANQQGPWQSCDYFAVVSKDASLIEG